jgi:hypothetical protein
MVMISWLLVIVLANSQSNSGSKGYLAGIVDKHRLLGETPPPRIILVGGSNVAFGFDSGMVHQEMGTRVVNMGVNAGVGLRFMLNQVRPSLRPGDMVVIIPEYEQFYGYRNGGTTLVEILSIYPEGFQYLDSPDQWLMVVSQFPGFAQGLFMRFFKGFGTGKGFAINRSSYNEYGDITGHLDQVSGVNVVDLELSRPGQIDFDDNAISIMNDFAGFVQAHDARFLLVFPALPEAQYKINHEQIEYAYSRLKAEAHFAVLGSPRDYLFPTSYFFDTVYHLNRQGRAARTEKLINALKTMD